MYFTKRYFIFIYLITNDMINDCRLIQCSVRHVQTFCLFKSYNYSHLEYSTIISYSHETLSLIIFNIITNRFCTFIFFSGEIFMAHLFFTCLYLYLIFTWSLWTKFTISHYTARTKTKLQYILNVYLLFCNIILYIYYYTAAIIWAPKLEAPQFSMLQCE